MATIPPFATPLDPAKKPVKKSKKPNAATRVRGELRTGDQREVNNLSAPGTLPGGPTQTASASSRPSLGAAPVTTPSAPATRSPVTVGPAGPIRDASRTPVLANQVKPSLGAVPVPAQQQGRAISQHFYPEQLRQMEQQANQPPLGERITQTLQDSRDRRGQPAARQLGATPLQGQLRQPQAPQVLSDAQVQAEFNQAQFNAPTREQVDAETARSNAPAPMTAEQLQQRVQQNLAGNVGFQEDKRITEQSNARRALLADPGNLLRPGRTSMGGVGGIVGGGTFRSAAPIAPTPNATDQRLDAFMENERAGRDERIAEAQRALGPAPTAADVATRSAAQDAKSAAARARFIEAGGVPMATVTGQRENETLPEFNQRSKENAEGRRDRGQAEQDALSTAKRARVLGATPMDMEVLDRQTELQQQQQQGQQVNVQVQQQEAQRQRQHELQLQQMKQAAAGDPQLESMVDTFGALSNAFTAMVNAGSGTTAEALAIKQQMDQLHQQITGGGGQEGGGGQSEIIEGTDAQGNPMRITWNGTNWVNADTGEVVE